MTDEQYFSFHTIYYFIVLGLGIIFIVIGKRLPKYDEVTGQIIRSYSIPFIVLGIALMILSMIGFIWFCEPEHKN